MQKLLRRIQYLVPYPPARRRPVGGARGPSRADAGKARARRTRPEGRVRRQPARARQRHARARGCAQRLDLVVARAPVAGRALRCAHAAEEPGIHRGGHRHAGGRDRPQHDRVYRLQRADDAAVAGSGCRADDHDLQPERSRSDRAGRRRPVRIVARRGAVLRGTREDGLRLHCHAERRRRQDARGRRHTCRLGERQLLRRPGRRDGGRARLFT